MEPAVHDPSTATARGEARAVRKDQVVPGLGQHARHLCYALVPVAVQIETCQQDIRLVLTCVKKPHNHHHQQQLLQLQQTIDPYEQHLPHI